MSKGVGREMGPILKIPGDVMEALRLPPDEAEESYYFILFYAPEKGEYE